MKNRIIFSLLLTSLSVAVAQAASSNETAAARYFDSIQSQHQKLTAFLKGMPKGGDLHNHTSGATYAENLIQYALGDHICIDPQTYNATYHGECDAAYLLSNAVNNPDFYDRIIDAWSMRHFHTGPESGHDHFFATFGKFGALSAHHSGEILAEIVGRAGLENESYLELMTTADGNESGRIGREVGWNPDFDTMRSKLLAAHLDKAVTAISTALTQDEATMRQRLACDTQAPKPGCDIKPRFLYQVLREQPPEMVFAQLLAGFEAASKDPRVVGINMVQPEDGTISMRDYALHMRMVGYLHQHYPQVHISLHAGELTQALVPPAGLAFHIHDAVMVANADRIGHGVDIAEEDQADALLDSMAARHVMVEINLNSNAQILNVSGERHPLALYMRHRVPVALSTDDEGVSRSNLTKEYDYAVRTYHFDYLTLKTFVRNSLMYSFLPGKALWVDDAYQGVDVACRGDQLGASSVSAACRAFLRDNEKAAVQWDLEQRFVKFEGQF